MRASRKIVYLLLTLFLVSIFSTSAASEKALSALLTPDTDTNLKSPSERLKTYYVCVEAHTASNENFPPISDKWQRDDCAKKISDCNLRFGNNLRFGGFPGTHAYPPKG